MLKINIIGAGLAGSECALYLANKGYIVNLYDIKGENMSPAHHSKDFAEMLGINYTTYSKIENNKKSVSLENAYEIAKRLNRNIEDIWKE